MYGMKKEKRVNEILKLLSLIFMKAIIFLTFENYIKLLMKDKLLLSL
jgi:hypothetical protein